MACKCAPACKFALDSATKRFPKRNRASDGCCGDAAHASRKSDHNPDASGYAHAFDLTHDPANGVDCRILSRQVIKDPRVTYVIFAGEIWKARTRTWEVYRGPNKHHKHMHVSIKTEFTFDVRPWPWTNAVIVENVKVLPQETASEIVKEPEPDKGVTTSQKPASETEGTPPPAPAAEVKASQPSWFTRIGSLSIPTGAMAVLGAVGKFVQGLPPWAWVTIIGMAMIAAYLIYHESQKRAHERTLKVMDAAASKDLNNLRLV